MSGSAEPSSEGIFVLAPHGRDAELTVEVLRQAGYEAEAVPDAAEMALRLRETAGAAVIAGEAIDAEALDHLTAAVAAQPPWSDFPFLVFTPPDAEESMGARALAGLATLGNVVLLERPIRIVTLRSAVETALRARRRQYAMRDLLGRVEDGIRQRDQFLAMLGHELRNPLAAVLTAAEVLDLGNRRQADTDGGRIVARQAGVIRRQGTILTRLVDDLLDVARVTSGKVPLDRQRLDVTEVVKRAVEAIRARAAAAGVEVTLSIASAPLWISGDATRLDQIVSNLLTNGVKYTPAGGRLDVLVRADGGSAVVAFRDTGVGIEPELLPHIFDLFKQADRTLVRAEGGLGIGLTLVRTLVELHGGSVAARSKGLGGGSEFVVRLPLAASSEAAAGEARHLAAPGEVHTSVFVVEDHEDNRDALVALLEEIGCAVESAADGAEGARAIVAARPDVAIVDIGLPGMDGYAVARYVRDALKGGVFLVALTGYGQPRDREMAVQAGFDVHMRKPVDVRQLRELVAAGQARSAQSSSRG
jgi:signal transduction histidine kinase/ActR/RegA family two-component response regulator